MLILNKSRLSYKIFLIVFTALLALMVLGSFITYTLVDSILTAHLNHTLSSTVTSVEETIKIGADLAIRNYLHAVAEQDIHILEDLNEQVKAGEFSLETARRRAGSILLAQKIGPSGYVIVLDSKGTILLHPHKRLEGVNVSKYPFVQEQLRRRYGFLEYSWKNPGDTRKRRKVLFMQYYKPWDWLVSVSAYRSELNSLVHPEHFAKEILAIPIGVHGYPFIVARNGAILVHPTLHGNVFHLKTHEAGLMRKMIEQKHGSLTYVESATDGHRHQRVVFFATIADYGWVVAATGEYRDFYAPLATLRNILILLFGMGLVASVLVALYLGRTITRPLKQLLASLSSHPQNMDRVRLVDGQRDEIEELTDYFSEYVHRLQEGNQQLGKLLDEQRKTSFDLSIFKEVFENVVEGIAITDAEGVIILANPAFQAITGYAPSEVIGQKPNILKSGRHHEKFYRRMWSDITRAGFWSGEIWNKRKNGEIYPQWLTISAICNQTGEVTHYAAIFNDISTIVEQQEKIEFLAYHDALTELPNRVLVFDRMNQAFSACIRHGGVVVCMIFDIDNFKTVNDSLGHAAGDDLLRAFVTRLLPLVRREETLCRMGSDEFVYIFRIAHVGPEYIYPVIERLVGAMEEPFTLQEQKYFLTLSIGVALYPQDAKTTEDLLKRADLALYHTKSKGGNGFDFFDQQMEVEVKNRLHYLEKIRTGLDQRQFLPFFSQGSTCSREPWRGWKRLPDGKWMAGWSTQGSL